MKARIPVAAVSAVIVLYCLPVVSDAARIPGLQIGAPNEAYVNGDSDPWVPDNRPPARIVQAPPISSELAPDTDATFRQPAATRFTWRYELLRLMRVLRLGGILR